jgi:hypothetical protein
MGCRQGAPSRKGVIAWGDATALGVSNLVTTRRAATLKQRRRQSQNGQLYKSLAEQTADIRKYIAPMRSGSIKMHRRNGRRDDIDFSSCPPFVPFRNADVLVEKSTQCSSMIWRFSRAECYIEMHWNETKPSLNDFRSS